MFRRIVMSVMAIGLLTDTAMALSCVRPDVARMMEDAKASDKTYNIFVGKFVPRSGDWPKMHTSSNQYRPNPARISTLFKGYALSQASRYDSQLSNFPVDVQINCSGPWCGSGPYGEVIAFVENMPGGRYQLTVNACPTHVINNQPGYIDKLRGCFDQTCQTETPDWY